MNLKDEEWEPAPTQSALLQKVSQFIPTKPPTQPTTILTHPNPQVRAATKSCVSTLDLANLRTALLSPPFHGAIPHETRGAVWLLLLRLRAESLLSENASIFAQNARESVTEANSREQIEKDVSRTRPGLARFKQPAVRGALLRLLSLFCARRNVAYVQGFNELLAPFVLLADTGGNPRIVFALFSEFVTRFAPWMLETSESRVFDVLKRMFKYFGRLLLYHDPELYWLLERHAMTPDLYATSWFVTLFARNFTVESVLALWDLLLLEDNPLGTVFFGVALLCSKREQLLSVDESRIPETLMLLTANSPDEVRALWKVGSTMRVLHTPPSFQRLMTDRLLRAPGARTNVALSAARAMQASVCLQTTPDDLVAGDAHYFTWDCRTEAEYNAGHLAQAAFLPLDALREANGKITNETSEAARMELQAAVDLCEPLKDSSHICLVGSGIREEDNMDINMLALYLTRIGIRYVSTLRGGFQEAVIAANSDDVLNPIELVDYDRKKHERARKARTSVQSKRNQDVERGSPFSGRKSPADKANAGGHLGSSRQGGGRLSRNSDESQVDSVSRISSADRTDSSPNDQGIASFLEKTDAEVSRAVNKALTGIGLKYSISPLSSGFSGERENGEKDGSQDTNGSAAPSINPLSPNYIFSQPPFNGAKGVNLVSVTKPSPALKRTDGEQSGQNLKSEGKFHRSLSSSNNATEKWATKSSRSNRRSGVVSAENSPRLLDLPSHAMSPKPGVPVDPKAATMESPIRQKDSRNSNGFFGAQRSPWGRDAKPGWLGDDTLSYPLSAMPKGFTVNVMDDRVMAGLRLFPCKARSDRGMGLRGRTNDFKKRYVGVSTNYLLLLSPHHNRNHLLEVKVIRYLQDISRITFKRSRPEVVTFEILTTGAKGGVSESIVCLMPDGLKECVALIKDYLVAEGDEDQAEETTMSEGDVVTDGGCSDMQNPRTLQTEQFDEDEKLPHKDSPSESESANIQRRHDPESGGLSISKNTQVPRVITFEKCLTSDSSRDGREHLSVDGEDESGTEAGCMEFGEFQAAPGHSENS